MTSPVTASPAGATLAPAPHTCPHLPWRAARVLTHSVSMPGGGRRQGCRWAVSRRKGGDRFPSSGSGQASLALLAMTGDGGARWQVWCHHLLSGIFAPKVKRRAIAYGVIAGGETYGRATRGRETLPLRYRGGVGARLPRPGRAIAFGVIAGGETRGGETRGRETQPLRYRGGVGARLPRPGRAIAYGVIAGGETRGRETRGRETLPLRYRGGVGARLPRPGPSVDTRWCFCYTAGVPNRNNPIATLTAAVIQ
jgi:hypothetical protein